jgi:hypothetical protein
MMLFITKANLKSSTLASLSQKRYAHSLVCFKVISISILL